MSHKGSEELGVVLPGDTSIVRRKTKLSVIEDVDSDRGNGAKARRKTGKDERRRKTRGQRKNKEKTWKDERCKKTKDKRKNLEHSGRTKRHIEFA